MAVQNRFGFKGSSPSSSELEFVFACFTIEPLRFWVLVNANHLHSWRQTDLLEKAIITLQTEFEACDGLKVEVSDLPKPGVDEQVKTSLLVTSWDLAQ